MADEAPLLTVVVVVGDAHTRAGLEKTMYSLLHQCLIHRMEVLAVDCSAPGTPPLKGSDHPSVRAVKMPRATTTIAQARAEGVRQARAPIVSFLDEHSFAMAGWAEALVEAHRGPWAGVGGEIYNGNSAVGFSDAIYLMGHGPWLPPAQRGEQQLLPSHDTCYKRSVLLSYGDQLCELLVVEPLLMWKLRADGHKLLLEPDVKSTHSYTVNLKTLVAFYAWSRCFGHLRAKVFGWPKWKRWLLALATPLVPMARVSRMLAYFVRRRPERLPAFLIGLPMITLAQVGAAVGQGIGLVLGMGNAEALFTQSHLRGLRWRADARDAPPRPESSDAQRREAG
ncbi:MAG TPA: glycosyltransferase [Anaerolineales bacterium]|nr:glycosyltransferase [Anaerolineales bacterium]